MYDSYKMEMAVSLVFFVAWMGVMMFFTYHSANGLATSDFANEPERKQAGREQFRFGTWGMGITGAVGLVALVSNILS